VAETPRFLDEVERDLAVRGLDRREILCPTPSGRAARLFVGGGQA